MNKDIDIVNYFYYIFLREREIMAKEIKIEQLPVYVTLTNKTNAAVKFAPYKENFNTSLDAGESLVLTATTAGQVFYYLKQACADVLEVAIANEKGTATYDVCATESAPATVVITAKEAIAVFPLLPHSCYHPHTDRHDT